MNTIEEQLWDYIDGNLSAAQARSIEEKIDSDNAIRLQYEELLALNLTFGEMELDEPSMSFARNVMERVAAEVAPVALKTTVNTRIVYGIAAFFIGALLAVFGYAVYSSGIDISALNWNLKFGVDISKYLTSTVVYTFLFVDLIIGLVFLDYLLRKKAMHK
ncbi:anti-sigma factor family protein [Pedobacter endophyticus]|uniref:Zf-HC2 domain-containing protein n=1 Tax=Pedobacter endophyticus TaxID=2789740 RepID=A0A7U3Q3Q4_9SPHI|nr:zf-HC2 domain-containing protein [Pedobacter endophyticus]QPH37996.1 zf-HC2 domain-containing protein [Pedobacter endophyticus]